MSRDDDCVRVLKHHDEHVRARAHVHVFHDDDVRDHASHVYFDGGDDDEYSYLFSKISLYLNSKSFHYLYSNSITFHSSHFKCCLLLTRVFQI